MRKAEAMRIINNTLKNKFNKENFKELSSNLFTNLNFKNERPIQSQNIVKSFRDGINSYEKIADFKNNGKEISVLTVELKKETSLDRARTMQRNFVAHHLDNTDTGRIIDAALVAFYHKNLDYWRLSFVKLDKKLKFDQENGGVNIAKELTPAKRYSFLVGEEEPTHTAEQQLLPLLKKETMPTLENIEEAFKIEKVTEEFFDKYKNHFIDLKEELEELVKKDQKIKKEFDSQNIHIVNFAKRIMSQLVFLYFIQKKGWLGVSKNKFWGSGPRNFMRKLFEKEIAGYDNFFNDILEPLFYEGLAIKRENNFYSKLNCKIPFLNGGLFEPLKNYDWKKKDILLDNEVFKDILDTFDLYNFTVREDEPLEKEVAVDPEMLGHVFEKLLDVEDRKAKGAYYTPSEVVHFMCQESLVNYLDGKFPDIKKDDLKILIQFGDLSVENDRAKINGIESYEFKMPKKIRMNAEQIDKKLQNIKICDPAIGSGAFPVGMMKEIVKSRHALSIYKENSKENMYKFKRNAIQNSIYGVDIDSGAVDIAKLRLWLSLVVDEEDVDEIKPLPNLDYKIMQGNSLIEEFMGINLDYEFENSGDIKIEESEKTQLFQKHVQLKILVNDKEKRINELIENLNKTNTAYLNSNESKRKKDLKSKINNLIVTIFEEELKAQKQEYFKELERIEKQSGRVGDSDNYKKVEIRKLNKRFDFDLDEAEKKLKEYTEGNKEKPFFLWKVFFADVFKENGGFDVVIANPPYVGEDSNKELFREVASSDFGRKYYLGKMDYFYFFIHKAIDISNSNATITFITTNYFLTANGAKKLRRDLKERVNINKLINFNEVKIFDSAKGQHNIISIFNKNKTNKLAENYQVKRKGKVNNDIIEMILEKRDSKTKYYNIKQDNLFEDEELYIRLEGANVNSGTPLDNILNKMKKSKFKLQNLVNIKQGVVSGCDSVSNGNIDKIKDKSNIELNDGIFVLDLKNKRDKKVLDQFSNKEKNEIVKPFYKNSEIKRYWCNKDNTKVLLYLNREISDISKYPNVKKHLLKFEDILKDRREVKNDRIKFHQLQWDREQTIFENEKIVVPYRTTINKFGYNKSDWFCRSDVYIIYKKNNKVNLKFLLSLLNSKLYYTWFYYKGKRKGETLELFKTPLLNVPIKEVSFKLQDKIINKVDLILENKKKYFNLKNMTIVNISNNYNLKTPIKLSQFVKNYPYKQIYFGSASKVGEMKVELKNGWAIIHSNDRELFKFKAKNKYKAEYLKLFLESMSDEKITEIDNRTGKIIEKILSIEIPGYDEDNKIKSLIEEWRQIQEEINFLEKKVAEIDNEIDKMVYDLYDLTQEEIDIVESNSN